MLRSPRFVACSTLVAVVVAVAWLIAWSDQPRVRYAGAPCPFEQIHGRSGPIDVLVVGTSRTKYGVDARIVADGIGVVGGRDAVVVNLGREGRGARQLAQLAREAHDERGVRGAIVIEFSREGLQRGVYRTYYDAHPRQARLLPLRELLRDPLSKPREPAVLRVRDVAALLVRRVDSALTGLIDGSGRRLAAVPPAARALGATAGCRTGERPSRPGPLAARRARLAARGVERRDLPPVEWRLDTIDGDAQRVALRRLIAEADDWGVVVVPVWLPRHLAPDPAPTSLGLFEREFGVPLLVPPASVRDRLDEGGYADGNHLNPRGRAAYSAWLGGELAARLSSGGVSE